MEKLIEESMKEAREANEYIELIKNELYYLQRIIHNDIRRFPIFRSNSVYIEFENNSSLEIMRDKFKMIYPLKNINEDCEYYNDSIKEFDTIIFSPYKKMYLIISHFVKIYRYNYDIE